MSELWHYDATEGNPRRKRASKEAAATAVRFKFQMMKALNVDDRLKPSTFKVAVALLDFMNGETGDLYPSIEAIQDATGLSDRTVRYGLEELRKTGWIDWTRGNRQKANFYQFDDANLKPMLARIGRAEVERGARRKAKSHQPDRQQLAARSIAEPAPDRQQLAARDRQRVAAQ